ncbi:MAG: rhodanese-like domain-containing protein [Desulfobacterales bacterium]|jgi:3-mercaptopyruvate sulfurtransferase SseA
MKNAIKALLALLSVIITMGAFCFTNRVVPPQEPTWDDIKAEARQGGYQLITTDELSRKYTAEPESLLLVDTRQEWEYRTGHIKKAVNFPMEPTWLSRWRSKGVLEKSLGSDKNRLIVFY